MGRCFAVALVARCALGTLGVVAKMREDYPDELDRAGPMRLAVGRVRLRSVARVGFSIGWIVSLIPALLTSVIVAWILHGIWGTLDGWTPWTPWAPNTRIAGFPLPTPEFRPREALHVDGFYEWLAPIGHHPFIGAALGTLALTIIGGAIFAIILIMAGWAYNLFALFTGGLEFEMVSRDRPRRLEAREGRRTAAISPRQATQGRREKERVSYRDADDDTNLRW